MKQYTFEEVTRLSYEELGVIDDPMLLAASTFVSPMLVRYVVRTGQLDARYPDVPLPKLLFAMNQASAEHGDWPHEIGQQSPAGVRNDQVEAYLNVLDTYEPMRTLLGKP